MGAVNASTTIRRATAADAAALAEFGERSFREAYAAFNDAADLELHVTRTYGAELQRRELTDPACSCLLSFAAEALVGYALLRRGPAHAAVAASRPCEVRRFYVDGRWHGRGIAPQLMEAAAAAAGESGADALWLTAWEHNPRALGFYAKLGFRDVGSSAFKLGSARQTDRVLVRPLTS
jgi:ribosomal protein S18 acetylase RimI-like enzyme